MVEAGFNCIRMSWVNATLEADLATIDWVLDAISGTGLRMILDNHRMSKAPRQMVMEHSKRMAYGSIEGLVPTGQTALVLLAP